MSITFTLPPWPADPPRYGKVKLQRVQDDDVALAMELSTDRYVPLIGSLPADASEAEARDWVHRQQLRHRDGAGFSFTIEAAATGTGVGHCGLWLRDLSAGRAAAGYSVLPSQRGQGFAADALAALTMFGWSIAELHRVELYIEPWNVGSIRTAERAGYLREGLLRSHQEIGGVRQDMLLYGAVRN
ncbi:GNAT family N-acetyltransferase [Nesterenkonia haasae]|uniref:GNAT family N-acetyltransferase n=1 Tax=Nesterenkonia haasae TaxID=2587813 RepID=UPI00192E8796|nr:GNAT family protein [Nesterenkonia haasae]